MNREELIDLINRLGSDNLPTNIFTIGDEDPMVILGKLNEVIRKLTDIKDLATEKINNSLQLPLNPPSERKLVGVDTSNSQVFINESEFVNSNPNLLINGDFRINQRGQTTYTESNKYSVDRWILLLGTVTVESNGITLNGSISQKLENTPTQNVTASVSAGEIAYNNGVVTITTTEPTLISWAKLEVGNISTPFSPRPYAEELAMCQRYFIKFKPSNGYASIANGYCVSSQILFNVSLPVELRTSPSVKWDNILRIFYGGSSFASTIEGFNISPQGLCGNSIQLSITATGKTYTAGTSALLRVDSNTGQIAVDAEIY